MMETVPATPTPIERKTVQEFSDLLEASKSLFNGLRDLPQYGQRQWQPYFAKTFETYTKLWKFQQENRMVLDNIYGLKRWQIGEIASKIGQLYYHYYLRTSEANYLHEAYHFYSAIRTRNYYKNAHKEEGVADLLLKKHRYYARFIVVCLLLGYKQDIQDLVLELSKQLEEHKEHLEDVGEEWTQVADPVEVLKAETYQKCDINMRLGPGILPMPEKGVQTHVTLGDAIIVGNSPGQLKFSELTIDMFRMVQVLERTPVSVRDQNKSDKPSSNDKSPQKVVVFALGPILNELICWDSKEYGCFYVHKLHLDHQLRANEGDQGKQALALHKHVSLVCIIENAVFRGESLSKLILVSNHENGDRQAKRENPHKYLLYRPTFYELFTFISSAVKELPPSQALLLYISAHGSKPTKPQDIGDYESGGVITNDRLDETSQLSPKRVPSTLKNMHCLHPGDLVPFTRKPLLLIIDSDNARAFAGIPNNFGQPIICLMAPEEIPSVMKDKFENGRLLTLFLYSPVFAFMQVCRIDQTSDRVYETCSQVVHKALDEAQRAYLRSRILDHGYLQVIGDDFMRLILLRFVFCFCVLKLHRGFKDDSCYPSSYPELPAEDFVGNPAINKAIFDIADVLGVRNLFMDTNGH